MAQVIQQVTITGPQMSQSLDLHVGPTRIGRHPDNDLVLVHPLVSRRHALLQCTSEACLITDLGSTHGAMVNRERLVPETPRELIAGDVIEIGPFRLIYEQTSLDEPAPLDETPEAETPESLSPPPPESALTPATPAWPEPNGSFTVPPGLSISDSRYLDYLPDIYRGENIDFIGRFLALLESILTPIEWNIDNFDLYLDPKAAPTSFLPWLANWFELTFDDSWSEESQRTLLAEAHRIYRRRGTTWALSRILEIYTGYLPAIDDQNKNLDPFTFTVRIPVPERQVNRTAIERLIDSNKPAHTSYTLIFEEQRA
jgi:phage tail-like protein